MCVPDAVNNLNVKAFSLMSRTNETRLVKWHEACKCKCRLNGSACNDKQHWNDDKWRCKCKELIDKGVCDRGFIWIYLLIKYKLLEWLYLRLEILTRFVLSLR